MNRLLALLLMLSPPVVCQAVPVASDCSTLKYLRHKVSCLCGSVEICAGDSCGRPSTYNLDDNITVELRDKAGKTILESKKIVDEERQRECTTQVGTKVSCNTTERTFCFEGKRDGDYQLAFVLFKNGVPQPAVNFPRTTRTNGTNLVIPSIWLSRPARGELSWWAEQLCGTLISSCIV